MQARGKDLGEANQLFVGFFFECTFGGWCGNRKGEILIREIIILDNNCRAVDFCKFLEHFRRVLRTIINPLKYYNCRRRK